MKNIFSLDLEKEIKQNNKYYRKVLNTQDKKFQLVMYNIPPDGMIDKEIHKKISQLFYIIDGHGSLIIRDGKNDIDSTDLIKGHCFIVPKNTYHTVYNGSIKKPLKFFSIYSPPHFEPDKYDLLSDYDIKRETQ